MLTKLRNKHVYFGWYIAWSYHHISFRIFYSALLRHTCMGFTQGLGSSHLFTWVCFTSLFLRSLRVVLMYFSCYYLSSYSLSSVNIPKFSKLFSPELRKDNATTFLCGNLTFHKENQWECLTAHVCVSHELTLKSFWSPYWNHPIWVVVIDKYLFNRCIFDEFIGSSLNLNIILHGKNRSYRSLT